MSEIKKSDQERERERKRIKLLSNYPTIYNKAVKNTTLISKFKSKKTSATLFGRIMAKRNMGKSHFLDLLDESGKVQLYINTKNLDNCSLENLTLLDIGDFCAAIGSFMMTKTNEITLRVEKFWIVTKALLPLPNKFTKLQNEEERLRKRYLDLLLNKDKMHIFEMRTIGHNVVRNFFNEKGFKEVQTPHLHTLSTGAIAKPFSTHHNALNIDMYLRIAPELFLKRLIAGNMGKVFEIARCYRNEGISNKHNPEFDLVEAYVPNANFENVLVLVEELVKRIAKVFWKGNVGFIKNKKFDLSKKFKCSTMSSLIWERFQVNILDLSLKEAKNFALKNNVNILNLKNITKGTIMQKVFDDLIEKTLLNPIFVLQPPSETSPLAKVNGNDPRVANRFELFINGIEIANGYDEQNDPFLQEEVFKEQLRQKKLGDEEVGDFDSEYLTMLKHGLPPTGGLGIGLDRLYVLLLNLNSIKDIILFPPLKTK